MFTNGLVDPTLRAYVATCCRQRALYTPASAAPINIAPRGRSSPFLPPLPSGLGRSIYIYIHIFIYVAHSVHEWPGRSNLGHRERAIRINVHMHMYISCAMFTNGLVDPTLHAYCNLLQATCSLYMPTVAANLCSSPRPVLSLAAFAIRPWTEHLSIYIYREAYIVRRTCNVFMNGLVYPTLRCNLLQAMCLNPALGNPRRCNLVAGDVSEIC